MIDPAAAVEFLRTVGTLKKTKRTGWVHKGVPNPESIADHELRVGMAAFLIQASAEPDGAGVDPEKLYARVALMGIAHDLAESKVGDITPHDGVSKEVKAKLELDAMKSICDPLGPQVGGRLMSLFEEYEAGETLAARLCKDLDKLDMIQQAAEYEQESWKGGDRPLILSDFFESTMGAFKTRQGAAWAGEVRKQREKLRAAAGARRDEDQWIRSTQTKKYLSGMLSGFAFGVIASVGAVAALAALKKLSKN